MTGSELGKSTEGEYISSRLFEATGFFAVVSTTVKEIATASGFLLGSPLFHQRRLV